MRVLAPMLVVGLLAGCAPDFSTPTSPVQWQRRQEAIEQRESDRQRRCSQPDKATDPLCSERPGVQP